MSDYKWQVFFLKKKKRLDKIVEYFCFAGKILLNFIFTFVPFISISLPQTAIAIIWPLTFVNLPIQLIEIDDSSVVIIVIKFSVRIELLFRSPCVFSLSSFLPFLFTNSILSLNRVLFQWRNGISQIECKILENNFNTIMRESTFRDLAARKYALGQVSSRKLLEFAMGYLSSNLISRHPSSKFWNLFPIPFGFRAKIWFSGNLFKDFWNFFAFEIWKVKKWTVDQLFALLQFLSDCKNLF